MDTTQLTIEDVVRFATALPVAERKELVRQIQLTLPYEGLSEDDPDFMQELERRTKAIDSGEEILLDHEVVMHLMRARIERAKRK